MHVLVIPAWFDISNPLSGIFFHEYCNALAKNAKVTLLNVNCYSFSDRFRKIAKKDAILSRKYNLINYDYFNPLPGKWLGVSALLQRKQIINRVIRLLNNYQQKETKIDVIHLQSVCNNITPVIGYHLANSLKIPFVVTEHYTSFTEAGEKIFQPFTSFSEVKGIVKHSYLNMAVSNFAARYCMSCFDSPFETVYNIIPNQFIESPVCVGQLDKQFRFLCIGTLQERKGQKYLLEAFASIQNDCPDAFLTLIGNGPDKEALLNTSEQLKISKKVEIIDFLPAEEFINMIDRASVIVSASKQELFGLTIIEGFFRGKPAIATRSGGPEELINYTNGMISDYADVNAMAINMKDMYLNYNKYNKKLIQNNAIAHYSESAIIPLMMENYKNAINKQKNN